MLAPTLTPVSELPCVPEVVSLLCVAADFPVMRASTVVGSSQPMFGSEREGAVVRPLTPPLPSACWISGTTRWE